MHDVLALGAAAVGGTMLGAIFFGGLWWTVHRGVSSRRPALWFIVSLLARTSMILAGIYTIAGGQWQRLVSCLLGFAVARLGVTWLMRRAGLGQPSPPHEAVHAP
ncbi:MAG: ATP synthase subunit I [Vicinamibacteraceae bacterium]